MDLVCTYLHVGGRQFKITANDLIVVNRIEADIGELIYLEKVGDMYNTWGKYDTWWVGGGSRYISWVTCNDWGE